VPVIKPRTPGRYQFGNSNSQRHGSARHWCCPTWSYHSGAETAPLVARETKNLFTSHCNGLAPP